MKKFLFLIFALVSFVAGAAVQYAPLQVDVNTGQLPPGSKFPAGISNTVNSLVSLQVRNASNVLQTAITANTAQLTANTAQIATNTAKADTAFFAFDGDADAYISTVGITDPQETLQIHRFVHGLKTLGLWTNCVELIDLRSHHNAGSGTTLYALKGGNAAITGSPTWTTNGLVFASHETQYATFANPMPVSMTNVSWIVGFNSTIGGTRTILNNYYQNGGANVGWGVFANGAPSDGSNLPYTFIFNYSTNTTTTVASPVTGRYVGEAYSQYHTLAFAGYSPTEFSSQVGTDKRYISTQTDQPVSNLGTDWRIGALTVTAGLPHSGDVGFVGAWSAYLSENQYRAIYRLYSATIGIGYAPPIEVIFEGDSLTAGTISGDYTLREAIQTNTAWGPSITVANYAVGGDSASNMVRTATSQWCKMRVDSRFFAKQYFVIFAGVNDLATGDSAVTVMSNLNNLYDTAKASGMKVVAFTLTPANAILTTTPQLTQWTNLNNLIRLNSSRYDVLIDTQSNTNLQDSSNTTYFTGGVHLTQAGYYELLKMFLNAIPNP